MSSPFAALVDDALAAHWRFHPVDASFAGETAYDGELPPSDAGAAAREIAALETLLARAEQTPPGAASGERLDARMLRSRAQATVATLRERPWLHNPAWATGEAAFGVIALLLPGPVRDARSLRRRLDAFPAFFAGAQAHLAGRAVPTAWVERARREAAALARLLRALPSHPLARTVEVATIDRALDALWTYTRQLATLPDDDPACGEAHLAMLMRVVHGLEETPSQLDARAERAFADAREELIARARAVDPSATWRELLERLATIAPAGEPIAAYRDLHETTMREAAHLVTPATNEPLTFAPLPGWAEPVANDLYFLPYRSPAAQGASGTSVYWVRDVPTSLAAIKSTHAVHHGSIGHHTQNARAREAPSRFGRIAGTDAASALSIASAGTLVEGWACYVGGLADEIPGFYTPLERVALAHDELRNIGSLLVDLRLHSGVWSLEDARRFYRDEVGYPEARIDAETTRNAMFPASRLMYWTGTQQIRALRSAAPLPTKEFHDVLLGFGAVPVAWIREEFAALASLAS